ncbi:MAG: RNA methyltransferase [Pirellulales bacterium]|nr:RNA methyltransferase [Pirellulales bacterium]
MTLITSIQNPRIKNAGKLRQRRQRDRQKRFLIDGIREIRRAHKSSVVLEEVFYNEKALRDPVVQELIDELRKDGIQVNDVVKPVFAKLAYGERDEGVVAVAKTPERTLAEYAPSDRALLVVLEGVEKPGNVGAVLRTADAAGVDGVVLAGGGTDLWNPNTVRASLGAIFSLDVCQASTDETIGWLTDNGFNVLAARVDAELLYTDADYAGRVAIALGSEADGLTPAWHADTVTAIRLPMHGMVDSLNVSAASAVVMYEAVRQRGTQRTEADTS